MGLAGIFTGVTTYIRSKTRGTELLFPDVDDDLKEFAEPFEDIEQQEPKTYSLDSEKDALEFVKNILSLKVTAAEWQSDLFMKNANIIFLL